MRRPSFASHRIPCSITGCMFVSTALLLGLAVGCPMGTETTDPAGSGQNAGENQMTGTDNSGGSADNGGDSSRSGEDPGAPIDGDTVDPIAPPAIAGTWKGKNVWEFTQTQTSPTEMSFDFSFESDFEITFGDDGRPGLLTLPLLGQSGASGDPIEADILDVGKTKRFTQTSEFTVNGETTTIDTVTTITVREAAFTENGFRLVYDFEMTSTNTGGQLGGSTQTMSGSSTYEAELVGDTLTYTQTIVQDIEQSFGGITQIARQEGTGVATLTRE